MRVFLSGNEDVCRWHLPVAQAKAMSFVERCEKAGLTQNTFHFRFEETGATMQAQYAFGQLSLLMHAPFIPVEEESPQEEEILETGPKTFFINTTQGYFWVEVRYDEGGLPIVILTPFEAVRLAEDGITEDFIYPGMGVQTAGMLADNVGGRRCVVTQGACVFPGDGQKTESVVLPASCPPVGRITPDFLTHRHVIISGDYEARSIRLVSIDILDGELAVDLKGIEASSLLAVEDGTLNPTTLHPNPCWVHRKCIGSYFSPNKTIGYHVDIGVDDEFLGNIEMARGGDLLDNTGGFSEPMFNHTPDLSRIVSLCNFPISIAGHTITIVLESPTMNYTSETGDKCWGGYGITQDESGCADYQRDFSSWMLSPRAVLATCNMLTGEISFSDVVSTGAGHASKSLEYPVYSWDGKYNSIFTIETEHDCDSVEYSEAFPDDAIVGNCDWEEECSNTCGYDDPVGYTGTCAKIWDVFQHKSLYIREELSVQRKLYFILGGGGVSPQSPQNMNGFFFLFEGFWHLDVGLHWSHQDLTGDFCRLCSFPRAGQEPGEIIYFFVGGSSGAENIAQTGHEYVENLEIVSPLGYMTGPLGEDMFGFIARVPGDFAAPHKPEVLVGGISYISDFDTDATVQCERALMSEPCDCSGTMAWVYPEVPLDISGGNLAVVGGCGPYTWRSVGADLIDTLTGINYGSYLRNTGITAFAITPPANQCGITVTVIDACGDKVQKESAVEVGTISGPDIMTPGTTATFSFDITTNGVSYSGTLEYISQSGTDVILKMPDDACGDEYTVTLSACGYSATKKVIPTDGEWVQIGIATWIGGVVDGIGDEVWTIFPNGQPGTVWADYSVLYGEAISGKYKCRDSILRWRIAGIDTCTESNGAPFCCERPNGYVDGAGDTTNGIYFHEYLSWNGVSRGSCADGEQTRIVWEWKCI